MTVTLRAFGVLLANHDTERMADKNKIYLIHRPPLKLSMMLKDKENAFPEEAITKKAVFEWFGEYDHLGQPIFEFVKLE